MSLFLLSKTLFLLQALPKVLNFAWRALSNVLPCVFILQRRQVQISSVCLICNRGTKTIMHVLIQYSFAWNVWILTDLGWQVPGLSTLMDWFCEIFIRVSLDISILILMVCWAL